MILVIASIALPVVFALNYFGVINYDILIYEWAIYILIFNTVFLIFISKYIASSISYPYSNSFFSRSSRISTNARFGLEFRRCIEIMTRLIKETTESSNN